MNYRCPYCKADVGDSLPEACPACGKKLYHAKKPAFDQVRTRRRTLEIIRRKGERQLIEIGATPDPTVLRGRRVIFGAMFIFVILGIALIHQADKASIERAKQPRLRTLREIDVLAVALGRYHFHVGDWPTDQIGLAGLARHPGAPNWNGPYVNRSGRDAWGTAFVYRSPAAGTTNLPKLFSCGADKTPDTPDDIYPEAAAFDPGTEWTNGWKSAAERWLNIQRETQPSRQFGTE